MGTIFFAGLMGGLAGFAAWLVCEPFKPDMLERTAWGRWEVVFITLLGVFVGCVVGGINGWVQGGRYRMIIGVVLGVVVGAIAGSLGQTIASTIFEAVAGQSTGIGGGNAFRSILARILAFIPLGALLGMTAGLGGLSSKRVGLGALGGALGGLLAGVVFDPIATLLTPLLLVGKGGVEISQGGIPRIVDEVGGPSRAVFSILMGAFVAAFSVWMIRVGRSAWIRLNLGRNEGKEWLVDLPQTFIGRSEKAHVPLFGDPNVAPMHAMIQRQGPQYVLMDGGSPLGTYVNGQRIQQIPLLDGAQIQIGTNVLTFSMKAGVAKRAAEAYAGTPYIPMQQPQMPSPSMPPQQPAYGQMPTQAVQPQTNLQPTVAMPAAQSAPASATLVAMDGPLAGQRFSIAGSIEVGREGGAIPLGFDNGVSRRHARFTAGSLGVELADLGSTNGTYVNGQRVQTATIRPGDTVKLGATTFRLE